MKKKYLCKGQLLLIIIFTIFLFSNIYAKDEDFIVQLNPINEIKPCVNAPPSATYVQIQHTQKYLVNQETLGEPPPFSAGTRIQSNGYDLDALKHSVPCVVDWNEDGKKDLLVGNFYGNIYLFLNSGTNTSPVYTSSTLLQVGGIDISVPWG